ncbi:MAG: tRNA glutamyl-Q(34) synthetase GluQRS [Polaromonas sp.]|uniref:tRNA glutamyl-Q(34) synthetase GluQRS n=1 Tax=Polaromonas sp. TaxID=1869339 RepID=UPI0027360444|nr:tRNA glutamyl-Q(34) synthetase GluQRS [Polaromonas sp.]MDP2819678.1 tRNA glutamyl-Q(34) synthetase GluQRS [Polaromonas sp.]
MQTSAKGLPAGYIGRFAPSPTGPLHAGSLVAALASWLDAQAHGGQWLVRIEDIDTPRCVPGADALILQQLAACGLLPDAPPLYQSQRSAAYQAALDALIGKQLAYPCGCTRQDIALALAEAGQPKARHGELVYPGTCRHGLGGRPARARRFQTGNIEQNWPPAHAGHGKVAINLIANLGLDWQDRRLGSQHQDVAQTVGDFVLQRADGLWAYQLAVVVDDGAQGISDVVRGEDLADNTARQILLQRALGLPTPRYLHVPLVRGADGDKLSKQNGAQPLDTGAPLASLNATARLLGLQVAAGGGVGDWLAQAVQQWAALYPPSVNTRP